MDNSSLAQPERMAVPDHDNTFITGYRKRQREPLLAADAASQQADLSSSRDPAGSTSAEDQVLAGVIRGEIVAA
jgi:hypothetical protein